MAVINLPSAALLGALADRLGPRGLTRDPVEMAPWLTDWRGRYHGRAAALVSPASTDEVRAVVSLCAAQGVAIVPQGGNTSMVGGATPGADGDAILLSLRRMDRIRSVSPDDDILVAEAGAILAHVHEAAAAAGRRFPLTLGAKGSATVGGLVSTNAGGTQVLRFGPMRALVAGLEAVLPDGSLYQGLSALRKDNRGYDLKQLLIGAEGTLGVVTAASLRLFPAVGARAVAWCGIATPGRALALLRFLEARIGQAVESLELVPRVALDLVLAHVPGTRPPLAAPAAWNVLVEAADADLEGALGAALEAGLVDDAALAASEAQAAAFWRLRDSISEAERHAGPALKHDISVPVAAMPAFVEEAAAALEARHPGARVIAFGHLGDGNVHFNVQPPPGPGAAAWLEQRGEAVSGFVYDLVTAQGGSISAEHGIGQMKVAALARTAPAPHLEAQRRIKRALDPAGIMNPGKLLPLT
ncbi:MAG: FAD-binding oxidoreductase [Alphaproteobacteria bacterium]|nr:FAD-binding oxidoreductase [Alphaproteobacteria bacterium]MBV9373100.1 FAD-binding oxidoreductase [Alphaproteobacteria bacterium]MBV9902870.1 FAD-binding oxidoreductase [Alphaproteobacteria bacterium]